MNKSRALIPKACSIIIPARDEEANIESCLESLCRLSCDTSSFEVVVADNGSTDRTIEVAESFSDRLDIRIVSAPDVTVAAVRNTGAATASGCFFAFLDSDCVVPQHWLALAGRLMEEHPKCVIGSFYKVSPNAGWPARLWYRYFNSRRSGEVPYVPASNLLISASSFRRLGGFDASLSSNEDGEICARARASGSKVIAVPDLAITHLGAEATLLDFVKRQFWHGSSVLNRAALFTNIRAIAMATYTLACLVWLIIAMALRHATEAPIGAALLPSALLVATKASLRSQLTDMPALFLLVLSYSVARALSLPIALYRSARSELLRAIRPRVRRFV